MLVMKFGGASVKNPEAVRNVAQILKSYLPEHSILVVVSAMDKTTNHLEKLAFLARDGKPADTWEQFRKIRDFHHSMVDELFGPAGHPVRQKVGDYLAEIERIIRGIILLEEFPERTYDRIVAYGELLSTAIVSHFLQEEGLPTHCLDSREVIKTDANYTQAQVIWSLTEENIRRDVRPLFEQYNIVMAQGFIASSMEGKVTTLGREGSDYTASIFASCLEARSLTVWKDVRGILNGDPRIESETVKLDQLSYERAVEMTFYGASVIHPKTIKPIRNAAIPLYVKCFLDTSEEGTVIGDSASVTMQQVCSRIVKKNQVLIGIKPKDFSFMDERLMGRIFGRVAKAGVEINLVQTSAISLTLCATHNGSAIQEFQSLLMDEFEVSLKDGAVLRTFIDYSENELRAYRSAPVIQVAEGKLHVVDFSS